MKMIYENELEMIVETKVKPNLKQIYDLRIKGLEDRQIAKFLGITLKQFLRVLNETEILQDVYEDATLLLCSDLRSIVIGRALGTDDKQDKDGNLLGPDEKLAWQVLQKIDPQFKQQDNTAQIVGQTVESIIKGISEKRREEERLLEEKNKERFGS